MLRIAIVQNWRLKPLKKLLLNYQNKKIFMFNFKVFNFKNADFTGIEI